MSWGDNCSCVVSLIRCFLISSLNGKISRWSEQLLVRVLTLLSLKCYARVHIWTEARGCPRSQLEPSLPHYTLLHWPVAFCQSEMHVRPETVQKGVCWWSTADGGGCIADTVRDAPTHPFKGTGSITWALPLWEREGEKNREREWEKEIYSASLSTLMSSLHTVCVNDNCW